MRGSKNKSNIFFIVFILVFFSFLFGFSASADEPNVLMINPDLQNVSSDEVFFINVYCNPVQPIKGYELVISFNPTFIKALSVSEGDFFQGFNTFFNPGTIDNTQGLIKSIYGLVIGQGNTSAPGVLCNISFSANK